MLELTVVGYLAGLAVITAAVRARLGDGRGMVQAVPLGWNTAALGMGCLRSGFLGDGVWHTIYGIEADLEALLSPTHLFMLAGGLTIMSGPRLAQ